MRVNEQKAAPGTRTSPVPVNVEAPKTEAPSAPVLAPDSLNLSAAAVASPAAPLLPQPVAPLGNLDYYRHRADDFKRRYPDLPPPSYYLGYGDKYANRFSTELYPKLSPAGQDWMVQARRNLQVAIEDRLRLDPFEFDRLERDDAAFQEFAYETHPKAYLEAGMERLPIKDLVRIGLTPDVRDLLTLNGVEQVADVAVGLAALKARRYLELGLTRTLPGQMGVLPAPAPVAPERGD